MDVTGTVYGEADMPPQTEIITKKQRHEALVVVCQTLCLNSKRNVRKKRQQGEALVKMEN